MFVSRGAKSSRYAAAISTSDTVNNLLGCVFIQNTGTSGVMTIRQDTTGKIAPQYGGGSAASPTTVIIYLAQGQVIECCMSWVGVNTTALGSGVTLIGFFE